jgi:hypothetical protein
VSNFSHVPENYDAELLFVDNGSYFESQTMSPAHVLMKCITNNTSNISSGNNDQDKDNMTSCNDDILVNDGNIRLYL